MAGDLGFEPRHTESESAVLPLHNSARAFLSAQIILTHKIGFVKCFFAKNEDFDVLCSVFLGASNFAVDTGAKNRYNYCCEF